MDMNFWQKQYNKSRENKNILQRKNCSSCSLLQNPDAKMKQMEFQHFKKAPHPFEQYGNLPPAAHRNRSIHQDYSSLPQGQEAFVNKVGKKQYQNKHKSSIKQTWLGSDQNDSLSKQLSRQNHKVFGKSLQTRDIEGAQGGSLKSPAVKYKQKAQQMKMHGMLNGFDHHDFEQEEYKLKIENAVKSQHFNDMEIGKLISKKGHGHMLNPERNQSTGKSLDKIMDLQMKKNSNNLEHYQHSLKQKYDNFQTKNDQYKQFFKGLKNKQDNYGQFFTKFKQENKAESMQEKPKPKGQKVNTFDKYDSKDMPTPKITSREYEYGLSEKYKTIETENERKRHMKQEQREIDSWKQQELLKNYQPPNFPKKSLQSQFKQEHRLGVSLNSSRLYNQEHSDIHSLSSSRNSEKAALVQRDTQVAYMERQLARKFSPTNLSHIVGSGSFSYGP